MTTDELLSVLSDLSSLANYSGTTWPLNARRPLMESVDAMEWLMARVSELERDAERYRWLRNEAIPANHIDGTSTLWIIDFVSAHDELDAAIDAALEALT